jgi:MarR family transcriptional regulator for hemolysin
MFVEPPTLVGVLDRMEHNGWIARQPCCEDRRKKWIVPQQAAESVWQKITECARELREQAAQGFTKSELATLRRFLSRVQANMSRTTAVAKCD